MTPLKIVGWALIGLSITSFLYTMVTPKGGLTGSYEVLGSFVLSVGGVLVGFILLRAGRRGVSNDVDDDDSDDPYRGIRD